MKKLITYLLVIALLTGLSATAFALPQAGDENYAGYDYDIGPGADTGLDTESGEVTQTNVGSSGAIFPIELEAWTLSVGNAVFHYTVAWTLTGGNYSQSTADVYNWDSATLVYTRVPGTWVTTADPSLEVTITNDSTEAILVTPVFEETDGVSVTVKLDGEEKEDLSVTVPGAFDDAMLPLGFLTGEGFYDYSSLGETGLFDATGNQQEKKFTLTFIPDTSTLNKIVNGTETTVNGFLGTVTIQIARDFQVAESELRDP